MSSTIPEDARLQLVSLGQEATSGSEESARFDAALARFHNAGWTYRQLAEALGVSRTYVDVRIKRGSAGDPVDPGIDVPERVKALKVIPVAELSAEMAEELKGLLEAALEVSEERTRAGLTPAAERYFAGLAKALAAGWSAYAVGAAIGVHPLTVGRFAAYHAGSASDGESEFPQAPEMPAVAGKIAWDAKFPTSGPVVIPDEEVEAIRTLAENTRRTRGTASVAYSDALAKCYLRGANRVELERATGQSWDALRKRLVRRGLMSSSTANK